MASWEIIRETKAVIGEALGFDETADSSEKLVDIIARRVGQLMDENPELLMSYLYRLDIAEHEIQRVLSGMSNESTDRGIARLIFKRQMERVQTKRRIKQEPIEGWDEW